MRQSLRSSRYVEAAPYARICRDTYGAVARKISYSIVLPRSAQAVTMDTLKPDSLPEHLTNCSHLIYLVPLTTLCYGNLSCFGKCLECCIMDPAVFRQQVTSFLKS